MVATALEQSILFGNSDFPFLNKLIHLCGYLLRWRSRTRTKQTDCVTLLSEMGFALKIENEKYHQTGIRQE